MSNDKNSICCNGDCNQGRTCPVRLGTHKPAQALHQISEPDDALQALAEKHGATSYRNRADTQHPAFGFTLEQLKAFSADAAAPLQQLIAEIDQHMRAEWDARRLPAMSWPADLAKRVHAAANGEQVMQHPDDAAVDALATLMKAKLAKQRAKGYGGWDTAECSQQRLSDMLRGHIDKGDPVDVANFCAFLSARGEGIAAAPVAEAPAQAVLDGRWKNRMLDGRALVRDEMGFGDHPELPMLDEGMKPRAFFAALGIELQHTMAEDDLELDEHESMNDAGNWSAWTPQPPAGDGWLLVAIFDTEDGQAAWWMRDADAVHAAAKGLES